VVKESNKNDFKTITINWRFYGTRETSHPTPTVLLSRLARDISKNQRNASAYLGPGGGLQFEGPRLRPDASRPGDELLAECAPAFPRPPSRKEKYTYLIWKPKTLTLLFPRLPSRKEKYTYLIWKPKTLTLLFPRLPSRKEKYTHLLAECAPSFSSAT
jgi:hypothetical protein